ncbi:MAG: MFS transporter, partial [Nocardioidaceae bacterium]
MTLSAGTTLPNTSAPRLFSGEHLALALGAVALVTLAAFENRAVGTALPSMVREFDAVGSFGVANAAPTASYIVALAVTGLWADRRGPAPPLRLGFAAFAVAQLLVGSAVSIEMVVAGRLLGGLAEGLLDIALMVLVARVLPPELRPRMFSLFAAAWVLPSVLGPVVTGVVTEQAGWRWVFLGALVLLVPTWLML